MGFKSHKRHNFRYPKYPRRGWIGVDLDGTLAECNTTRDVDCIGSPIPLMLERVHYWITTGRTVKIFTARAGDLFEEKKIHQWCLEHGLPELEITNKKDHKMIALWDDRAVGVIKNKGMPILPRHITFWQSVRLRLLLIVSGRAAIKYDRSNLQNQMSLAQNTIADFFNAEANTSPTVKSHDNN